MSFNRFARSYAALLVCAPLLAVACGSDDDTSGSGGTGGTGGAAGGAAGTGGNGGTGNIANSGGSGNTGNTSGNGGTGNTGNAGGDGGTAGSTGGGGAGGTTGGTGGAAGGAGGTTGGTGGAAGGAGGTTGGTGGTTAGTGGTTGGTGGSTAGTGGTTGGTGGSTAGTGGTTGGTGGSTAGTGGTTGGTGGTTGGTGGTTGGTGGTGGGTSVNLYFSEYIEGTDTFNKAVEVFNAGSDHDLSDCVINLYSNGSAAISQSFTFPADTLASGKVKTVCVTDTTNGGNCDYHPVSAVNFSGDDGLTLVCGGVLMDAIGKYTERKVWGDSNASTQNKTIRRLCSVTMGDRNFDDDFDPNTEWTAAATVDDYSDFGSYTCP